MAWLLLAAAYLLVLVGALSALDAARCALRTTPPGRTVVLFDGHCRFCTAQVKNLRRLSGAIDVISFQEPGALTAFPGVTHDACMRAMHLITPAGRVYPGFEAAVHSVATRGPLGWLAFGYYLPGVRQLCDAVYAVIARNRYKLIQQQVDAGACDGSCALHLRAR